MSLVEATYESNNSVLIKKKFDTKITKKLFIVALRQREVYLLLKGKFERT
jgi:hypothetical protein